VFDNDDIIFRYTRADAIRDGALIDVSAVAREAGFKYPVALTAAAWAECVADPPGVECQDEAGRLWDLLWLLRCAILGSRDGAREVRFAVHVRNDNREGTPPLVRLKALYGPGDQGEPVITVMMPDEDCAERCGAALTAKEAPLPQSRRATGAEGNTARRPHAV
jgi:hypothetical protein